METDSRKVELGREHSDFEWIKIDELKEFKTLGQRESLEKLGLV